jgi:hypothetical protein
VAALKKLGHEFRSDETAATDHDDFHTADDAERSALSIEWSVDKLDAIATGGTISQATI